MTTKKDAPGAQVQTNAQAQTSVQKNAGNKPAQGQKRKYYGKRNPKANGSATAANANGATSTNKPANANANPKPKQPAGQNKPAAQKPKNTQAKQNTPQTKQTSKPAAKQTAKQPAQNNKRKPANNSAKNTTKTNNNTANNKSHLQFDQVPPERLSATEAPRRFQKTVQKGTDVPLHIIPLGGLEEVGKNVTLYECQGDMIMVDCGAIFPDDELLGVDLVIPDFTYVIENQDKIKGVFITHGHEDHIGAIPYLLKKVNLPIYGTKLTLGLISNKLKEHGLLQTTKLMQILPGDRIKAGCFTVEPFHVNHSIPDAVGFGIDSPAGLVVTTGDFKIDYTPIACGVMDLSKLAEYGERGVLALLSDSTNAERPGFSRSDRTVGASFASLFKKAEGKRIIIASFASNIYRIQQILDLAEQTNRKVVVFGRSMVNNTEMAFDLGYLHAKADLMIAPDQMKHYNPEELVIVTTGSQGEPLAALSRMSMGMHRDVHVGSEDFIIISATPIPGNEKGVSKTVNNLMMLGAEVIYESMYDVHVSGHAYQDEQKLVLSLVKPKYFFPVHGEFRQLKKHAILAEGVGVDPKNVLFGSNGDVWRLNKDDAVLESKVPAEGVLVDGLGVGDVGSVVLRDRTLLAQDGLVMVAVSIDKLTKSVVAGPEIFSRGFVYVKEADQLMKEARKVVTRTLNTAKPEDYAKDYYGLKNKLREQLSQFIYKSTKRTPMMLAIVMEV